jgi:hypothetical protein
MMSLLLGSLLICLKQIIEGTITWDTNVGLSVIDSKPNQLA